MSHDDATPPAGARRHQVPAQWDGTRLDRALTDLVPDTSRSRLATWIKEGGVRVDGEPVTRPSHLLRAGSVVEFEPPGELRRPGGTTPIAILFEDDDLALVDKPAGVVCHPSEAIAGGTVSEQLVERYGDLPDPHADAARVWAADAARAAEGFDAEEDDFGTEPSDAGERDAPRPRPGIVHRLDARTSGIMVVAKSARAGAALLQQFAERRVKKTYLALVHGEPRFVSDYIESPIVRDARRSDRMAIAADGEGRDAETFYETQERFDGYALVAAQPRTGRTHQIRVHLESIELPIVGDTVYKGRRRRQALPKGAPPIERQALHAWRLELEHPITGAPLVGEAPLASDMKALLEWLRSRSQGAG